MGPIHRPATSRSFFGEDLSPKRAVPTWLFAILWLTFLVNGQAVTYVATLYKVSPIVSIGYWSLNSSRIPCVVSGQTLWVVFGRFSPREDVTLVSCQYHCLISCQAFSTSPYTGQWRKIKRLMLESPYIYAQVHTDSGWPVNTHSQSQHPRHAAL